MKRPTSRRAAVAAVAMCSMLVVAACANPEDSDTASPPAGTANPTGEPILIGVLVPDAGVEANPQVLPAVERGLAYVNGTLNGIDGRPLEFEICHSDGTPSKAISCANDFVEKGVVAVLDGFDRGAASGIPVYKSAGIPVIGNVAQDPIADADTSGTYFAFGPANAVYAAGPFASFKEQGIEKIVYALNDVAGNHDYADKFLVPLADELGLDFTAIYYDPASPNFATVGATIASLDPDLGGANTLTTPAACTQFIQALRQAGFQKTILAATCVGFEKTLGAEAKDVQIFHNVWLPSQRDYAPENIQEQLDITNDVLAGVPEDELGFYTYETFATLMDLTNLLGTIDGAINPQTITSAVEGMRDVQSWTGPEISCGIEVWPGSSACSDKLMLSTAQGDGTVKPEGGGFLTVSPPE